FGPRAITTVNDDLHLDAKLVEADVVRFREALDRGDPVQAAACYAGPFLDGFHLPDAPEFDQWMAGERDRLARELSRALEAAAKRADARGEQRQAADLRQRLVELDPLTSAPVLALMHTLGALGEPAAALEVAARHARALEDTLGTRPTPEIGELATRLRTELAATETGGPEPPAMAAARSGGLPAGGMRQRKRVRVALAGVIAVAVAVPALRLAGFPGGGVSAGASAANRVVVLPFVVRGGERFGYLGEGMVDLLAATLDGAGSLRTTDPHAVLGYLRRHRVDPGDPAAGKQVAAQFKAGHYVLGTIVESGGRIGMRATMYRADGEMEAQAIADAAEDPELFTLVDGLTRQLLAQRYDPKRERLSRLAVMTSASLPAVKAYLNGEARHRVGDREAAADAFRAAVREDSSFALAWYRLAVAAEWALQPHEAALAVERAVQHAGRLPERDRLLLVGWREYARGQADQAEAVYRRVLDEYPDEFEAWLQLGEIQFHYAPARGTTIEASRAAFERVLALEPTHEAARVHLARVAALRGDQSVLAGYVSGLVQPDPSTPLAMEMRTLLAFALEDGAAIRQLETEFRNADSFTALGALLSQFYVLNLDGVAWCGRLLTAPARPREVRSGGHLILALVELARGRLTAARQQIAQVEALDSLRGAELRGFAATLPFLPEDRSELTAVRRTLEAVRPAGEDSIPESFFLPDHDRLRPFLRAYLRGLVNASLGDSSEALGMASRLDFLRPPSGDATLPADLARAVRGELARRAGRTAEALAAFDEVRDRPGYQLVLPAPFDPRVRERFLRGTLLEQAGRTDEARAVLATVGRRSLYDLPFLAPAQLRIAALAERGGDRAAAREHRRLAASLWSQADSGLQLRR
ncbi:MAG: BTAD domain-containing putative transcriptional regulator, partial [Gemmatimonadales bacterium]